MLPLNLECIIPSDDKVRLLSQFVEELDLIDLYRTYERVRKSSATPKQMLKVVLYAAMCRIYSSRDIESSCRRDINFMYLLEGSPAPDHATIARFKYLHFAELSEQFLSAMSEWLYLHGKISGHDIFIDGTKIESCASVIKDGMDFRRYRSRGKKNVLAESVLIAMARNLNKLHQKIQMGKTGTHLFTLKSA